MRIFGARRTAPPSPQARGLPLGLLADADPVWLFAATPDDVTESPEVSECVVNLVALFLPFQSPARTRGTVVYLGW